MPERSRIWVPDRKPVVPDHALRLRLLSFNIQVGLRTAHFGHYLSRAWRHALPSPGMHGTLDRMAELMGGYDFVAIQEADAGSLRTRFVNQMEYLARRAGYAHFGHTVTRELRPFARHSLGFLSRVAPVRIEEHPLPSRIPGRRAMRVDLGPEAGGLTLIVAHLSLSRVSRRHQLDFLSGLVPPDAPAVLLGDLNCEPEALRRHEGLQRVGLWLPDETPHTFPSWKPRRSLDHILVSPGVEVHRMEALPHAISDHLPLAADIALSAGR